MPPLATVGILSIGDMGMGIAKLLIAHNYRVVTNLEGRSADTASRVQRAAIESLPTDTALVSTSDYILSIVPPRDALSTARRITTAFTTLSSPKPTPLYYLDLNAISPRTAKQISSLISSSAPTIKFIDGGIIGGAPKLKEQSAQEDDMSGVGGAHPPSSTSSAWGKPYIPLSGPSPLSSAPISGAHLADTLNTKHIANEIGPASGLKCCFASLSKGFTALCIQSFTTANNLGVLEELKGQLGERMPGMLKAGSGGVTGMPPKAYRWVREMEEIGITHAEEGGFEGGREGEGVFGEIAKVYRSVAEETVLGEEKTESRKRGLTIDDVASAIGEGLREKRKKME